MAYRKEKMEEQIRRLVSEVLIKEIKDPRIGFVSVTSVSLKNDYSEARVGLSVLGNPRDIRKTWEGIHSAVGFIQHKIGKALHIRHTPRIEFFLDSSVADGVRMVELLNELEETEKKAHEHDDVPEDSEE